MTGSIDVFIISPYTHEDPMVVRERLFFAKKYLTSEIKAGRVAFSVIAAYADLCDEFYIRTDYGYWEDYCKRMIEIADEVHVLCLKGWEESVGMAKEIIHADNLDKPVKYIEESDERIRY